MRLPLRWPSLLALLMLVLAACGDDDAADDTTAEADDAAPAEEAAEPDADAEEAARSDESEGDEAFEDLLAAASSVAIAITYEGVDERGEPVEMTWAQDPPTIGMAMSTPEGEGRIINVGDGTIITCGAEGGAWECLQMEWFEEEMVEELLGAATPFMAEPFGLTESDWGSFSSATIAGRQARCASGSFLLGTAGDDIDGASEICADEETGALLRVVTEQDGEVLARFEAVDVGDPDPSLFEPPSEPVDLEEAFGEFPEDFDPDEFDPEGFDPEDLEDLEDFDPESFGR